jgi:hypothetical protein
MAIQGLEQRLDSLLPKGEPTDEPTEVDMANPMEQPQQEDVQVAGLGSGLEALFETGRVIGKAITTPTKKVDTSMDDAAALASQKAVQDAAIAAEKKSIPGAVQAVKKAIKTKRKKGEPVVEQPIAPATTEQIQEAIAKVDEVVEVVPPTYEETIGVIKTATPEQADKFLNGTDVPAIGIDFNFAKIQDPTDINRMIDATSKMVSAETDIAKRGVISDDVLNDMATRLNIAPDLLRLKTGETMNAEQLLAGRHLLVKSANHLNDLTTKIKAMPAGTEDDKLLLEFRNHLATHAAIQMKLKAAQTETARALRSFRLPVDGSAGLTDVNQINALIQEMGGRDNMKNLANAYSNLTLDQQARFVELAGTTSQQIGKVWKELHYFSIMSSPATTERALFGNLVLTAVRSIDTTFASTVGRAIDKGIVTPLFGSKSSDQIYGAEAVIEMITFFHSIPTGLKAGFQSFITDAPVYKVGRDVDKTPDPAISAKLFADPESPMATAVDYLGKAIRLVPRSMQAVDEFSKAMIAAMETKRLAARDALMSIQSGVDTEKALDGMALQISSPDARIVDKVNQAVLEGTLQSDLGSFGNALSKIRNEAGPVGTVLAPFIKSVINMQKQMLARTPVMQLALKEIRDDYAAGGARRQMAMGKASTGAAFMGYAYTLALNGDITGAGPSDPERRKFLTETTGWQPFSRKVGVDKNGKTIYQSYAGLEPIGGLVGVAATIAEIGSVYGADGDDDYQDLLVYSALMPFKYIGELPFMKGINDFTSMIEEANRNPKGDEANQAAIQFFGGMAGNFVGGVVPIPMPAGALLRQIENTIDPTKREVTPDPSLSPEERYFDFMFRKWLSKTPIGSEKIKPSRNLWGEEVKTGENSALYWIMPFNRTVGELDPVEAKILEIAKARQGMPLKKPERTIANIRLNDNEYSDLLLMMNNVVVEGQNFKGAIGKALNDPIHRKEMANGAYEGITSKLSNIQSEFKEAAVNNPGFAAEYPDLSAQIQKNKDLAIRKYKLPKRELSLDLED